MHSWQRKKSIIKSLVRSIKLQDTDIIINEFLNELSEGCVLLDADKISAYANTTYHNKHNIFAMLTPKNKNEVITCLSIANKYKIAVYPVSSGLNWGYGLIAAEDRFGVILNLCKLNKIVDYNEKLAYAVIEPGVSFKQLSEFLARNNSELMLSATGSSPETSIIGNTLEKGIGTGSYGERARYICGLEIILPSGECIQTSFGRFDAAAATNVNWAGMGPCLDGLFLQSNIGIVTQMTIWLRPIPEYLQLISFSLYNESKLPLLLNQLQFVALHGYAETGYTIFNDYKMLMANRQYPWSESYDVTPIPSNVKDSLKEKLALPEWKGHLQIKSASPKIGDMQKLLLASQLKECVDDLQYLASTREQSKDLIKQYFMNSEQIPKNADNRLLLKHLGVTNGENISSVYWRVKALPPKHMHPASDGCGLLWVCPVIPFTANHIVCAISTIKEIMLHSRFEPAISISVISDKSVVLVVSIVYDKSDFAENDNANRCKDDLFHALAKQGYYPYRLPANSMYLAKGTNQHYQAFLNKIKMAVDPNIILAPNRYI